MRDDDLDIAIPEAKLPLSLLTICHQKGQPDYDVEKRTDKNRSCFVAVDGEVHLKVEGDETSRGFNSHFDVSGEIELHNADGDDAGKVSIAMSGSGCGKLSEAFGDRVDQAAAQ